MAGRQSTTASVAWRCSLILLVASSVAGTIATTENEQDTSTGLSGRTSMDIALFTHLPSSVSTADFTTIVPGITAEPVQSFNRSSTTGFTQPNELGATVTVTAPGQTISIGIDSSSSALQEHGISMIALVQSNKAGSTTGVIVRLEEGTPVAETTPVQPIDTGRSTGVIALSEQGASVTEPTTLQSIDAGTITGSTALQEDSASVAEMTPVQPINTGRITGVIALSEQGASATEPTSVIKTTKIQPIDTFSGTSGIVPREQSAQLIATIAIQTSRLSSMGYSTGFIELNKQSVSVTEAPTVQIVNTVTNAGVTSPPEQGLLAFSPTDASSLSDVSFAKDDTGGSGTAETIRLSMSGAGKTSTPDAAAQAAVEPIASTSPAFPTSKLSEARADSASRITDEVTGIESSHSTTVSDRLVSPDSADSTARLTSVTTYAGGSSTSGDDNPSLSDAASTEPVQLHSHSTAASSNAGTRSGSASDVTNSQVVDATSSLLKSNSANVNVFSGPDDSTTVAVALAAEETEAVAGARLQSTERPSSAILINVTDLDSLESKRDSGGSTTSQQFQDAQSTLTASVDVDVDAITRFQDANSTKQTGVNADATTKAGPQSPSNSTPTYDQLPPEFKKNVVITIMALATDVTANEAWKEFTIILKDLLSKSVKSDKIRRRRSQPSGFEVQQLAGSPTQIGASRDFAFEYYATEAGKPIASDRLTTSATEAGAEYAAKSGRMFVVRETTPKAEPKCKEKTCSKPSTSQDFDDNPHYVRAILGIIGAVAGLIILVILTVWLINRRRSRSFLLAKATQSYGKDDYNLNGIENPVMAEGMLPEEAKTVEQLSSKPTNGHATTAAGKADEEAMIIPLDQLQGDANV